MAGSVKIDLESLGASIAELQALNNRTEVSEALNVVATATPTQSLGGTAGVAKLYHEQLLKLTQSLAMLFTQTITVLQNAEEYFTLTDEELALYIARKDGGR